MLFSLVTLVRAMIETTLDKAIEQISNSKLGSLADSVVDVIKNLKDTIHDEFIGVADVLKPENVCGALQ